MQNFYQIWLKLYYLLNSIIVPLPTVEVVSPEHGLNIPDENEFEMVDDLISKVSSVAQNF